MTIIVTRHAALVDYLREIGLVSEDAQVVGHASPELIRGNHVVGILPLHLAALADRVTVVPLEVPADLRGQELSLEQVRQYAGQPATFRVSQLS